ncbi:MAG: LysM peptidoglycan-binding domain-containing protein, partial [Bacteroidota bacterium]
AYSDEGFSSEIGTYSALVNPESIRQQFAVDFDSKQPEGASAATLKFKGIQSPRLDLQFLFDSTGAIDGMKENLVTQLSTFQNLCMGYDGDIHRTPFLVIAWGTFIFKGVLLTMDLEYQLFRNDGTPVRALANCSFQRTVSPEDRAREENNNSPDMTHVRVVQEGDTLVQMTYRIYGDIKYYPQIARINHLTSFRDLKPGDRIVFPPIDASAS